LKEAPKKEEKESIAGKFKNKFIPVDQSEKIKAEIKKQEEKIQALKNSVNVYFVDKCLFVNLRENQGRDSLVLEVLKNGELIEPIIYNDTVEWTKIRYKEKTGYIMTKYIGVETSIPVE